MTLFLRNRNNESLCEIELWVNNEDGKEYIEISSSVNIKNYSIALLSIKTTIKQLEFVSDFVFISEIRGWLWEHPDEFEAKDYNKVLGLVKGFLSEIAKKYDLSLIED